MIKKFLKNYIVEKAYKKVYTFYASLGTIHPKTLDFKESDKILILAPHPDDEVIGCGGLLLKYSTQCDVIVLTDGRYGDSSIPPSEMIKIRKEELTSVMKEVGIKKYLFLDIEDSKLKEGYEQFQMIDFNHYNYIVIPNNLDQHPDHKAVFSHIMRAFKDKLIQKDVKIAMYEVWGALAITNFYIDISDIVDKKRDIINMHYSQVKDINYADKILGLNKYRGMTAMNKEYVESYFILNIRKFMSIF